MTKQAVARLVFMVLGAYLFLSSLAAIPGLIGFSLWIRTTSVEQETFGVMALQYLGPFALQMVLGMLLWYLASWLAATVFPNGEDGPQPLAVTERQWLIVAFFLIGIYLLAEALPDLMGTIGRQLAVGIPGGTGLSGLLGAPGPARHILSNLAGDVSRIVIGGALVLLPQRIVAWLLRPFARRGLHMEGGGTT